MPAYAQSSANLPITGLRPGDQQIVWNAENPLTGTKSQAVALDSGLTPYGGPQFISVEVNFSGAPGAFTIQIQTADTDQDAFYVSEPFNGANPGQITTVNANNTARVELQTKARFVRLLQVLQNANAVNMTAKISR